MLSANPKIHDKLSGRTNAFANGIQGIKHLLQKSVYVAVNVVVCSENINNLADIFDTLRLLGVKSVLITRYIPCRSDVDYLHITDEQFIDALNQLKNYQIKYDCFSRISMPQPFKLCKINDGIVDYVEKWNIPCMIGICTATISPNGALSPCNLEKKPVLGDLKFEDLVTIWNRFDGVNLFCERFKDEDCLNCCLIGSCGGGCKAFAELVDRKLMN